jgi:hypothetical protein
MRCLMRWEAGDVPAGRHVWTCEAAWGSTATLRARDWRRPPASRSCTALHVHQPTPFHGHLHQGRRPNARWHARFLRLRIMPQMNAIINVTRRDKLKNGKLVFNFIIARVAYSHFSRQRRAALTACTQPVSPCVEPDRWTGAGFRTQRLTQISTKPRNGAHQHRASVRRQSPENRMCRNMQLQVQNPACAATAHILATQRPQPTAAESVPACGHDSALTDFSKRR